MASTRYLSDVEGALAKRYVRTHKDLYKTWGRLDKANQDGTDSTELSYWKQRMDGDFNIEAFGEAHRGMDMGLFHGTLREGGIQKSAKEGEPTDAYKRYFKGGLRELTGTYEAPQEVRDLIGEGFDVDPAVAATESDTQRITTEIKTQATALNTQIDELKTQLKTMTDKVDRQSLGIPPDAPAHIKTYEQYREWLMRQNAAVGYGTTVTTSMSGVEDMTEGVSKPLLTAVYPTSG